MLTLFLYILNVGFAKSPLHQLDVGEDNIAYKEFSAVSFLSPSLSLPPDTHVYWVSSQMVNA